VGVPALGMPFGVGMPREKSNSQDRHPHRLPLGTAGRNIQAGEASLPLMAWVAGWEFSLRL